jgi:hypothetical protein
MKSIQDHKKEAELLGNLLTMVTVSQELSAMEIKKLKEKIAHEEEFFNQLNSAHEIVHLNSDKTAATSQDVAVYISTQSQFTGSLTFDTFQLFLDFVKQSQTKNVFLLIAKKNTLYEHPSLKNATEIL